MKRSLFLAGIFMLGIIAVSSCKKDDDTDDQDNNNSNNTVAGAPVAVFTANPETGYAPLEVTFDASGSSDADGTISTYSWDFGDNSTAGSGVSCSYNYTVVGTYTVVLTVTDNDNKTATYTKDIVVSEAPGPQLYPLDKVGAQWAYSVSAMNNPMGNYASSTGSILVTLVEYNESTMKGKFAVTGDLYYYASQELPSEYYLKETNDILEYSENNSTWYTVLQTSGSWSGGHNIMGRPVFSGQNMSASSSTANTYACEAADDNWDDNYATMRYEYYWKHTINTQTGMSYSKWYDYDQDLDPQAPLPSSYSTEITLQGYSIPQSDGTALEYGSGTSVQVIVSSFSPGVTSGEDGMVIYNRTEAINITFSMDMDKNSVEQNFLVYSEWDQTALSGTFTWNDDKSFTWQPSADYPDGYIMVTLPVNCQSATGYSLFDEFQFYFFMDTNS